jgi:putative endonuclease
MSEHQAGVYRGYTSSRRPVELVWLEEFADINQAIDIERQVKGWSRKKKEALMRGDFILIHQLAQSKEMVDRRKKRTSR